MILLLVVVDSSCCQRHRIGNVIVFDDMHVVVNSDVDVLGKTRDAVITFT